MSQQISVAILGISGRMGRTLVAGIESSNDLKLGGALDSADSRWINQDAGTLAGPSGAGIVITDDPSLAVRQSQVAVNFTLPQATLTIVRSCVAARCPLVLGTTGHTAEQLAGIEEGAKFVPIVMASNFSLGVNLLFKLTEIASKILDEQYDIEIYEAHHRNKKDAPSGTALSLGEAAATGRATSLAKQAAYARHGETGVRGRGQIGFSVVRGGDIVGDHTVMFAGPGERVEITHRAHDRMGFAQGALRAARWIVGQPPGLYSMRDVLGL